MKKVDRNGFWTITSNPISKVGIFPYLGSQIDSSLEADKVYMVLRPAEELFNQEALDSFNTVPVPLVDEHTMLGEEYTPAEKKGIDGVVQNIRQDGDVLVGDIAIYSEEMKEKITHGKKELSMGYFCTYDIQEGEYNGEHYDAIQRNIRSNHIALVDKGRCGSDVRVFDKWCFDAAISITNEFNKKEKEMDTKDAEFEESKHPRAENGQFTSGGGGSTSGSVKKAEKLVDEFYNFEKNQKGFDKIRNIYLEKGKEATIEYLKDEVNSLNKPIKERETKLENDPQNVTLRNELTVMKCAQKHTQKALEWVQNQKERGSKELEEYHTVKNESSNIERTAKEHNIKIKEIVDKYKDTNYVRTLVSEKGKTGAINEINNQLNSLSKLQKENLTKNKEYNKRINEGNNELGAYKTANILHSIRTAKRTVEEALRKLQNKNTASDSGCMASKDDAIVSQSKLKELRNMIDKEKLAALKEIVAMLESDEPVATQEDEGEVEEKKEDLLSPDMSKNSDEENSQEEVEEEDEDDIEKEKEEKLQKSEDAMSKKIFSMLADRDNLAKKVTPIIGGFDYSKMTVDQVAKYACDKLDISTNSPKATIEGYLKGYRKSEMYSMDTATKNIQTTNSQIEAYLKGE